MTEVAVGDWRPLPGGQARPDERLSQFCEVACETCGAVVRAAKFSVHHTSVQWDAASVRQCAEFSRQPQSGEARGLIERCLSMRATIDAAALAGRLPIAPPWPDQPPP